MHNQTNLQYLEIVAEFLHNLAKDTPIITSRIPSKPNPKVKQRYYRRVCNTYDMITSIVIYLGLLSFRCAEAVSISP